MNLEIWNKDSHTVAETIKSCPGVTTFGDDIQCVATGVAAKTLTSNQVVRVYIKNSGSGPTVSIAYDDSTSSGDSRATLPVPEFHEVAMPVATILLIVLVLRRRLRGHR